MQKANGQSSQHNLNWQQKNILWNRQSFNEKQFLEVRLGSTNSPDSCFSTIDLVLEYPNLASTDVCAGNKNFNVKLPSLCYQAKNETAPADRPHHSHYDPTESNIAGIICCLALIIPSTGWYCYCSYKLYRFKMLRRRAVRNQRMTMEEIAGGSAEAGPRAETSAAVVKDAGEDSRAKVEKSARAVSGGSGAEMTRDDASGKKHFEKVASKKEQLNEGREKPNSEFITSEL